MSRKAFVITCSFLVALLIALIVWAASEAEEKTWDVCYPMTNVNVSWQQTFYGGPWSE